MTSSMPESISSVLSLVYDTMPLREPNDDDDEEEDDDEDSRTSGYQGTRRRRIGHPIVVITPIVLPWLAGGRQRGCCWNPATDPNVDFSRPTDDPALISPHSVSSRSSSAALLMELAEPRVRSGVWEHTTFRVNPILRLRRTGLAAMVTIYGPRRPRKRALRFEPEGRSGHTPRDVSAPR